MFAGRKESSERSFFDDAAYPNILTHGAGPTGKAKKGGVKRLE